jgi:hypothetical protein
MIRREHHNEEALRSEPALAAPEPSRGGGRSERRGGSGMKRIAIKWTVLAAVIAGVAVLVMGATNRKTEGAQVVPADTTICTTCIAVTGPTSNPVLYPGAGPSQIPVTFTNTTNGPVYVTSLAVSYTNTFNAGCGVSNFVVDDSTPGATKSVSGATTTITYSPAQTIPAGQTWTDNATLTMPDTKASQDACQGQSLAMSYTGKANYTVMTNTGLTEASNPSTDTATLTATVAPDIQPASAAHTPGPGDGSVTFYSCKDNTSANSCFPAGGGTVLGTAPVGASGVATLSIPAGSVGSYNLEAVYAPADPTNFVTSTSPIVTSTLSGCVNVQTTGASTIIAAGQTITGNYTVPSGSSVWLNGGTINGNVTVLGNGQFAATGGTVTGSVQSSGGPVALSGTTVGGNVQQQNGGLSLGPATIIRGNAQDIGGGPFCSQGTSGSQGQVQIKLNLTVQSLSSTTTSSVCSTTVGNNLQWQSNSSPGVIGSCGGNTVLGNLIVQNNSGTVTIGATDISNANHVSGNVTVSGNTGGGTIINNSITGNCLLNGDKPGIVGSANNTGKGNNQCNTTSAGA